MVGLPTGTTTFLFTDIEGSTRLWEELGDAMNESLEAHDGIVSTAVNAAGGTVFKSLGDGFCAAFPTAAEAVRAAVAIQESVAERTWNLPGPLRLRIAVHTGEAIIRGNDYFGQPLNRISRILAAGHGGQILLSSVSMELIRDSLPSGWSLRRLGRFRLRDLTRPETIYQLDVDGLESDFAPLRSLESTPNNLPLQPTSFVGRTRELEDTAAMLGDPSSWLMTIVGPGGIGKTRLALQLAANSLDAFGDGVYFVDLQSARNGQDVADRIVGELGIELRPGEEPVDSVIRVIGQREILLVLDNCEQIGEAGTVVAALHSRCGGLRLVATSREPLHVRGERVFRLPPMAVPEDESAMERLGQFESVQLFLDRVTHVQPGFRISNETAPAVAEICSRLDGLPLAIELAAAWIRHISPSELLSRLSDRLDLLKSNAVDLPARQRTIRATLDWSYDLLDETERHAFHCLSAFAGSFTATTAEAVCGSIDCVSSLADKSLLRSDDSGESTRFRMLSVVREYAAERDRQSAAHARRQHADYVLARVLESGSDPRIDDIEEEIAPAIEYLIEESPREALSLFRALDELWESPSRIQWALTRLPRVLGAADTDDTPWVRLLFSRLLRLAGSYEEAHEQASHASDHFRAMDDEHGMAHSENELGWSSFRLGDLETAHAHFARCREAAAPLTDEFLDARAKMGLGNVYWRTERLEEARNAFEQCVEVFFRVGRRRWEAQAIGNFGVICYLQGHLDQAVTLFERVAGIFEELDATEDLCIAYNNLGSLNQLLGNHAESIAHYERLVDVAERTGNDNLVGLAHAGIADARRTLDDLEGARTACELGLSVTEDGSVEAGVCRRALAEVEAAAGDASSARQNLNHAIEIFRRSSVGEELAKAEKALRNLEEE